MRVSVCVYVYVLSKDVNCVRCAEYVSLAWLHCTTDLPLASLTECVLLLVEFRHNPEERLRWDGGNFRTFEVVSAVNGPVQQAGQCCRCLTISKHGVPAAPASCIALQPTDPLYS